MAQTTKATLGERLDALKAPSKRLDDYGNHACGCTWDSGPFGVFCSAHDADALVWDAFVELHEAADAVLGEASDTNLSRLLTVVAQVARMRREGAQPAT